MGTTQDPFTQTPQTETVQEQPLPCSYQEPGVSVVDVYGQRNTVLVPTIYLAQDPEVEVNDVATVMTQAGKTIYLFVSGEAEPVARGRLWSVECSRTRAPAGS